MNEWRNEVMQAESAILKLAEEMARVKGLAESVTTADRQIREAADALERARLMLQETRAAVQETTTQARASLTSATEALNQSGRKVTESTRALSDDMHATINKHAESVQTDIKNAANSLTELRSNVERHLGTLTEQSMQLLHRIAAQDLEIKRLSKFLAVCLMLTAIAVLVLIGLLAKSFMG